MEIVQQGENSKSGRKRPIEPFLLGLLILLIPIGIFFLPHLFPTRIGTAYIWVYGLQTVLMLYVWKRQSFDQKSLLFLGVFLAISLAIILPYTSNDTERYLWDGAVFLSGVDPYLIAPNDPAVADLRALWPTPEEHSDYPTLYPPGALLLFSICALTGPVLGIWIWGFMTTIALIATLAIGAKLLEKHGAPQNFALLALSPLLMFETQIGGHLDIFCVLGLVSALYAIKCEKFIIAGLIIGLAATIKFLPAIIVGPFLFYLKPRQAAKLFLSSAFIWCFVYTVFLSLGYKPLGLLPVFFEKWRGGAPLYPVLESLSEVLSLSAGQFLFGGLTLAVLAFAFSAKLARDQKIFLALGLSLSVPLLLSPVLFPWYLLILIPILMLRPNMTLILVMGCAPLSYVVLDRWLSESIWVQPNWPSWVLLFAIIFGLVMDRLSKRLFLRKPVAIK